MNNLTFINEGTSLHSLTFNYALCLYNNVMKNVDVVVYIAKKKSFLYHATFMIQFSQLYGFYVVVLYQYIIHNT